MEMLKAVLHDVVSQNEAIAADMLKKTGLLKSEAESSNIQEYGLA